MQIPFSKSEISFNTFLSFKEKRQLVRVIELCLSGYDKLAEVDLTSQRINSTRAYEKIDVELSKADYDLLMKYKDKPIVEFLSEGLKIER